MTTLLDLQRVLDTVEEKEAKLLIWGDTGGWFSEDEILKNIEEILPAEDPEDVLDELEGHAMLLPVNDASGRTQGYRSRMGESVHLYRNLRQWFHGKTIEQSSTLVSDYRFLRKPRQYPKRDHIISELIEKWSFSVPLTSGIKNSLVALVGEHKLSGFQVRSTERILTASQKHHKYAGHPSSTIICAGTGSGKTMAFYLPVLSSLVSDLLINSEFRVRALAIYPRKELLKDQFNEAWEQCRKLDAILHSGNCRKLRIGAMFGDTPDQPKYALKDNQKFRPFGLLKCATNGCNGEMRWNKEDIQKGKEILRCNYCNHSVSADEVALTRHSMANNPPDILFTTTEMLNQQMGNPSRQKLFGIGTGHSIPLVLLDEVHTYGGNQGAQVALLLRRWMKLSKNTPHFVGLSATLVDAENYFSRLTGTNPSRVRLVEPIHDELTEEGAEYLVVLRGDPVSQTALLSTTIQTAMLTRRLQDRCLDKKSSGTWGCKTFVFTDELDVNNRLFYQLSDAEGWMQQSGRLIPKSGPGPLAQLRNPSTGATSRQKLLQYGQDWSAVKIIGFGLNQDDRAKVSRTSSQDSGVDASAEIIVATASLEVGFNDPDVGAIIQHKAPREVASYLQRKGRAGRLRITRPWMLIVLSEFGRDRVTYQHYERLLDPEVKLQALPIDNSHIQRMQAAMAVLDWLGMQVKGFNPWSNFNNPRNMGSVKENLRNIVNDIIDGGRKQEELIAYLIQALVVDEVVLNKLLWQPPRSILMELLPTLRRRFETNWGIWSYEKDEIIEWAEVKQGWCSPIPEFIPDNLFSDLNLPTLHVALRRGRNTKWEGMRFFQGLREFAPGRVSKRFSIHAGQLSDWLVPEEMVPNASLHNSVVDFDIEQAFGGGMTFIEEISDAPDNNILKIYQPHQINTLSLSSQYQLAETSNAYLNWRSLFRPGFHVEPYPLPSGSVWSQNFISVAFYTHSTMSQLEVIRYNTGSNSELKFRNGQKASVKFKWCDKEQSAGIGARMWVDAAKFEFKITAENIAQWLQDQCLMRALRSGYLQDQLREEDVFEGNKFKSDWVYECFIAAISLEVVNKKCEVTEALDNVCSESSIIPFVVIPEMLFQQDISVRTDNEEENGDKQAYADQKLQSELKGLLTDPLVLAALHSLGKIFTVPLEADPDFLKWCRNVIGNTLAGAIQQTVCTLLPDVDDRELLADPVFQEDILTIWLCEQDSGGTGIITQLQDNYTEDPLKVLNILAQSIQGSVYEQLDNDLYALLACSNTNKKVSDAFEGVRKAASYHQRIIANKDLKRILIEAGFQYSHSFATILYSRILRPGSGYETDKLLEGYLSRWQKLEEQIGFELLMNIAALAITYEINPNNPPAVIFAKTCQIQSVLWPRGNTVRQAVLAFYNPFRAQNTRTERFLVAPLCDDKTEIVTYEENNWLPRLHDALINDGRADLLLPREMSNDLSSIIATLHVTPLDMLGLLLYPRIYSIKRQMNNVVLRVELAESIQ